MPVSQAAVPRGECALQNVELGWTFYTKMTHEKAPESDLEAIKSDSMGLGPQN